MKFGNKLLLFCVVLIFPVLSWAQAGKGGTLITQRAGMNLNNNYGDDNTKTDWQGFRIIQEKSITESLTALDEQLQEPITNYRVGFSRPMIDGDVDPNDMTDWLDGIGEIINMEGPQKYVLVCFWANPKVGYADDPGPDHDTRYWQEALDSLEDRGYLDYVSGWEIQNEPANGNTSTQDTAWRDYVRKIWKNIGGHSNTSWSAIEKDEAIRAEISAKWFNKPILVSGTVYGQRFPSVLVDGLKALDNIVWVVHTYPRYVSNNFSTYPEREAWGVEEWEAKFKEVWDQNFAALDHNYVITEIGNSKYDCDLVNNGGKPDGLDSEMIRSAGYLKAANEYFGKETNTSVFWYTGFHWGDIGVGSPDGSFRISTLNSAKAVLHAEFCGLPALPTGLINVALEKTVTVDSELKESYGGANAVDGDNINNSSRWLSKTNDEEHWLEVDLGGTFDIEAFAFWTGFAGYKNPIQQFSFQYEKDGAWVDIVTEDNNDNAAYRNVFDVVTASKVRLYVPAYADNDVKLFELEVYVSDGTPQAPETFSYEVDENTHVTLSWNIDDPKAEGVVIERSNAGEEAFEVLYNGDLTVTSYKDETSVLGEVYDYRIHSTNTAGVSPFKTLTIDLTPRLVTPSEFKAEMKNSTAATLTWTKIEEEKENVGLRLERRIQGEAEYTLVAELSNTDSVYVDTDLVAESIYEYIIYGYAGDFSSEGAEASVLVTKWINVALNKTTETSTVDGSKDGSRAVDGDIIDNGSRWVSSNSGEEQWITVDLGAEYDIQAMGLWTGGSGIYDKPNTQFSFQYFKDDQWMDIISETNNTTAAYFKEFEKVKTGKVRYYVPAYADNRVRLYEIMVYVEERLPNAPTTLEVSVNENMQVDLSWADVEDVMGYEFVIERSIKGENNFVEVQVIQENLVYTDTTVQTNTSYDYRLYTRNKVGKSETFATASADIDPVVTPPTDIRVTVLDPTTVNLTWTLPVASDHDKIIVSRKLSSEDTYTIIATLGQSATSYEDSDLAVATEYMYAIHTELAELKSEITEVTITTEARVPNSPTTLEAVVNASLQVELTWANVEDVLDYKFVIERSVKGEDNFVQLQELDKVLAFTDADVMRSTSYDYRLYTMNNVGKSEAFASATVDVPALLATPSNLAVTAKGQTSVSLSWTLPEVSDHDQVMVSRKLSGDENYEVVATLEMNETSYTDISVVAAKTYTYAVYTALNGNFSDSVNVEVTTDLRVPNSPTTLTASVNEAMKVELAWTNVVDELEYEFVLERSLKDEDNFVQIQVLDGVVEFTDTDLNTNASYDYRLYTMNEAGKSEEFASASVDVPALLAVPANLEVVEKGFTTVSLSWTLADVSDHNNVVVSRKLSTEEDYTLISTLEKEATSFEDSELALGTEYIYAIYTLLNESSSDTVEVTVTTDSRVPSSPTALTAVVDEEYAVELTWEEVEDELAYEFVLERAVKGEDNFEQIQLLDGALSYTDTEVDMNTSYDYRLYTMNEFGKSESFATASVTIPALVLGVSDLEVVGKGQTTVSLSWVLPEMSDHDQVIVSRKLFTEEEYVVVATLDHDATSFEDTGLELSTAYTYAIHTVLGEQNSEKTEVTVTTDAVLSIGDFEEAKFVVYPNPSSGQFFIKYTKPVNEEITITVLDVIGKTQMQVFSGNSNQLYQPLEVRHQLRSGIYFIRVDNNKESEIFRILIK
ncbi:discoidin domain-containing protein [Flammeovirga aprica]|uniref:T9SS type A sorting domain-containing protein n=1 Tax=Flammeovirga aprica JL-4 TaxID=694437 RepID=A0A7X9RUV2_9BACT|nr:discoidin domain-containing protein [Flammeovirga aprica]NME69153.1 T9SS type A sorting domain-containing protein [Flammeovirga aprica JL-4]